MPGRSIRPQQHKHIWELSHDGAVVSFRPTITGPVLSNVDSVHASDLDPIQIIAGLEASGQRDNVGRVFFARDGYDGGRCNGCDGILLKIDPRGMKGFKVFASDDAALDTEIEVSPSSICKYETSLPCIPNRNLASTNHDISEVPSS